MYFKIYYIVKSKKHPLAFLKKGSTARSDGDETGKKSVSLEIFDVNER